MVPTNGSILRLGAPSSYGLQGSDLAVFLLAPILLLLSQDPLLSALTSRRRYFPMALAISSYLGASSALQVSQMLKTCSSSHPPANQQQLCTY